MSFLNRAWFLMLRVKLGLCVTPWCAITMTVNFFNQCFINWSCAASHQIVLYPSYSIFRRLSLLVSSPVLAERQCAFRSSFQQSPPGLKNDFSFMSSGLVAIRRETLVLRSFRFPNLFKFGSSPSSRSSQFSRVLNPFVVCKLIHTLDLNVQTVTY